MTVSTLEKFEDHNFAMISFFPVGEKPSKYCHISTSFFIVMGIVNKGNICFPT